MEYSLFTQYGLESAKMARDKLKDSKRKRELYNLYRDDNDLERKFYNSLEVPMREFLYKLSKLNFMNFRRLDRLVQTTLSRKPESKETYNKHNVINGGIATAIGGASVYLAYLIGLNLTNKFNELEFINKVDTIGLETLLLTSGILLTSKGIKRLYLGTK